jgi:hypothetical protein
MLSQNDIQYILYKIVKKKDIEPAFVRKDAKITIDYSDSINYPFCNNYKIQKYMYCTYENLYEFDMDQSLDMVKYRLSPIISILDPIIEDQEYIFSHANHMPIGAIKFGVKKRINDITTYLLIPEIALKYSFDISIKSKNLRFVYPCMIKHFISDDGICRYPHLYKKYAHKYRM